MRPQREPATPGRSAPVAAALSCAGLCLALALWFGIAAVRAVPGPGPLPLDVVTVHVGDVAVEVEVADTLSSRTLGLQFRESLPEGRGMLFVFPRPDILQFWMRNTPIDLDIAFFAADRRLLNVAQMTAFDDVNIHASHGMALYALEVNRGWFARHGLGPGARLRLPE